jgi:MFS superfamily sulfate permease-like transporter
MAWGMIDPTTGMVNTTGVYGPAGMIGASTGVVSARQSMTVHVGTSGTTVHVADGPQYGYGLAGACFSMIGFIFVAVWILRS